MKTIIFDIDGTLTDMSPVEKSSTWRKDLPKLKKYPLVKWIIKNRRKYIFVYATGGIKSETLYALKNLGIIKYFDLKNSTDKDNCQFSKKTGIPFRRIKKIYPDCILVTDSKKDCIGAEIAQIPFILIR
jgi:phosphoglycolate phosphatase-like HAD superfamily hydrolase